MECADCGVEIGHDSGPKDGWQREDGRTVCHACCVRDTRSIITEVMPTRGRSYLSPLVDENALLSLDIGIAAEMSFPEWVKRYLREIATGIGVPDEQPTIAFDYDAFLSIWEGPKGFSRRCKMPTRRVLIFPICHHFARCEDCYVELAHIEKAWRRLYGRCPPGSQRTRRLRKKREKRLMDWVKGCICLVRRCQGHG